MTAQLSSAIEDFLAEERTPWLVLGGEWIAVFRQRPTTALEHMRQSMTYVAGYRLRETCAPARLPWLSSPTLVHRRSGRRYEPRGVVEGYSLLPIGFSPADRFLSWVRLSADGNELWVLDVDGGSARRVNSRQLNCSALCLWTPLAVNVPVGWWLNDREILTFLHTDTSSRHTTPPAVVHDSQHATVTNWLPGSPDVDAQMSRYLTSHLTVIDVTTGRLRLLGEADHWVAADPHPRGQYVLVQSLEGLSAPNKWLSEFARSFRILDCRDGAVHSLLTPGEERIACWAWSGGAGVPAISWAVAEHDTVTVYASARPFSRRTVVATFHGSIAGVCWRDTGDLVATTHDVTPSGNHLRLTVWTNPLGGDTSTARHVTILGGDMVVTAGRVFEDRQLVSSGQAIEMQERLCVAGADVDGRPWLRAVDVSSGEQQVIFESRGDRLETPVALLADGSLIIRSESTCSSPHFLVHRIGGAAQELSPSHQRGAALRGHPVPITYRTPDGATLEATLRFPTSSAAAAPPVLIWLYPRTWRGLQRYARTRRQYERSYGISPLPLLEHGFAVADEPSFPIDRALLDDPHRFVGYLTALTESLVGAVIAAGADPARIIVGGYCYGAYVAALMMANTRLFRASVLWGGLYNLMMFPSGLPAPSGRFQPPGLWEGADRFVALSPICQVARMETPTLIMHGSDDRVAAWRRHAVDFATQAQMFFTALQLAGRPARYVNIPFEAHFVASADALRTITQTMIDWCVEHAASESRAPHDSGVDHVRC